MHPPANVVTIRRNCVVLKDVLTTYKAIMKLVGNPNQEHPTSSCETLINSVSVHPSHEELADVRKEQCARIGCGAVLAEHPQVVASSKAL